MHAQPFHSNRTRDAPLGPCMRAPPVRTPQLVQFQAPQVLGPPFVSAQGGRPLVKIYRKSKSGTRCGEFCRLAWRCCLARIRLCAAARSHAHEFSQGMMYVEIEQHINDDGTEIEMSEDKMSMLLRELPSPASLSTTLPLPLWATACCPRRDQYLYPCLRGGGLAGSQGSSGHSRRGTTLRLFFHCFPPWHLLLPVATSWS